MIALAVAAASSDAAARSVLCDTVRFGDTASAMARRLTGSRYSVARPWFQIIDPATSKVVPKTAYDRILSGWQVCVPEARLVSQGSQVTRLSPVAQSAQEPTADDPGPTADDPTGDPVEERGALKLALVLLGPAALGAAIAFAWYCVERFLRFLTARRSLKREAHYFGDLFVKNFERPLVIEGFIAHPIRARLRWGAFNRRLEIMLAPAAGRRYPNLDDHRRNVEYDVDRIAHRLRHHPLVRRPLRAEGEWVVVPFQVKSRP